MNQAEMISAAVQAAEGELPVKGFRLGPGGAEYENTDAAARQRIAELELRIAALEARPAVWSFKDQAAYDKACAAGKTRDNDIIFLDEDPPEEADSGTGAEEGSEAGTESGTGGGE